VAHHEEKVLLCRRAISPRLGMWTLPAGFLENDETAAQGAARETWEEARARVGDLVPYALFNIVHVQQLYLMFRAPLLALDFRPGSESAEVALFREQEIPWGEIAFTAVHRTLRCYYEDRGLGRFGFHMEDIPPPERSGR
jgi:ADP-ribose pyrophosphatase YjhB (NUDIX family)